MRYDHKVKVNGIYYAAGEDVPESEEMADGETQPSFSDSDITFEELPEKKYTKTEINRMNKAELQELARNTGIDEVDDMTGTELKEYLYGVFEL